MNDDDFDSAFAFEPNNIDPQSEGVTPEITEEPQQTDTGEIANEASSEEVAADERGEHGEKNGREIPLATFLDMRDKKKEAEQRAAALEARIAEFEKANQQAPYVADPERDPQGFAKQFEQRVDDKVLTLKMQMSRSFALQQHPPEKVQSAIEWAQARSGADPRFDNDVIEQSDPIGWIIKQHEEQSDLEDFRRDRNAYILREAAKLQGLTTSTQPTAQAAVLTTPKTAKVIPNSLTDAPTATGKASLKAEQESFDSIFDIR